MWPYDDESSYPSTLGDLLRRNLENSRMQPTRPKTLPRFLTNDTGRQFEVIDDSKPFFMVYGGGVEYGPKVRHATRALALAEAKRLALLNPDSAQQFFVMTPCDVVSVPVVYHKTFPRQ